MNAVGRKWTSDLFIIARTILGLLLFLSGHVCIYNVYTIRMLRSVLWFYADAKCTTFENATHLESYSLHANQTLNHTRRKLHVTHNDSPHSIALAQSSDINTTVISIEPTHATEHVHVIESERDRDRERVGAKGLLNIYICVSGV